MKASKSGRFITLEGGEGVGKTTQVRRLAAVLEMRGRTVVVTREPGGSAGAEDIRRLIVQGEPGRWDPLVETMLIFAARADHVRQTIRPALARGEIVLCDRFSDSTYAYQGAGRGLPRETIRRIEAIAVPDIKPDLTLVLDLPAETGLRRAAARKGEETRFEGFDIAFHERLREAFRDLVRQNPERCALIEAGASPDAVAENIERVVESRLGL
jgi:dTMP kinase